MSEQDRPLDQAAAQILRDNDRGGYTVPTEGLYPFQWNWDSCLVALGWAQLDEARAFQEIETLFTGQWPDGMVPQIVFHKPDPAYFPGPERWGTHHMPMTSGITQPPVAASCVRRVLEHARDAAMAERRTRALFPKLLASHRWFHTVRDPDATGLVTTLHPWETGMDNSPAWDEALARVEVAPDLEPYVRKDTTHVDPSMRPTKAEYDRFMTLVQLYRQHGWRHEITKLSPFRMADVATNCILLRADRDLLTLAERLGEPAAADGDPRLDRARRGVCSSASSTPPPASGTASTRPQARARRRRPTRASLPSGPASATRRSPRTSRPGSPRRRTRSRAWHPITRASTASAIGAARSGPSPTS